MNTQPLQLLNLTDLWQFHRYVRSHHIHGTVRQNGFVTNARNTVMLAFGLPLLSATLEIAEPRADIRTGTEFCPAIK